MTKGSEIAKIEFDEKTTDLIKRTVASGATDQELQLFLYQAKRTGLDPLTRQIYFIKIGTRPVMMASIDGFRVIADRSGNYAGQDEPEYIYENGALVCAKVKVYKWHKDQRFLAATGVAFKKEYEVANSTSWAKMPHVMLAKVAEGKALRQAFPQDLSGLYAEEEMDQAKAENTGTAPVAPTAPAKPAIATQIQARRIFALGKALGYESEKVKEIIKSFFKLESFTDLTAEQAVKAINSLQKKADAKASEELLTDEDMEKIDKSDPSQPATPEVAEEIMNAPVEEKSDEKPI